MAALSPGQQPDGLRRVALFMHERADDVKNVFGSFAQPSPRRPGGAVTIERPQIATLAREVMPDASPDELRLFLLHLDATMDSEGDGRMTLIELQAALGLAKVLYDHKAAAAAAAALKLAALREAALPVQSREWVLQEVSVDKTLYLRDDATGIVYHLTVDQDIEPPVYPRPAGKWVLPVLEKDDEPPLPEHGTVKLLTKPLDLNELLEANAKKQGEGALQAAFQQVASMGVLSHEQVGQLLMKTVPKVNKVQLAYFNLFLQGVDSGEGKTTYVQLESHLKELSKAKATAQSTFAEGTEEPELSRVADAVDSREGEARGLWAKYVKKAGGDDGDDNGSLQLSDVKGVLQELLPELSARELRLLVVRLSENDLAGTGMTSFRSLQVALNLLKLRIRKHTPEPEPEPVAPTPRRKKRATTASANTKSASPKELVARQGSPLAPSPRVPSPSPLSQESSLERMGYSTTSQLLKSSQEAASQRVGSPVSSTIRETSPGGLASRLPRSSTPPTEPRPWSPPAGPIAAADERLALERQEHEARRSRSPSPIRSSKSKSPSPTRARPTVEVLQVAADASPWHSPTSVTYQAEVAYAAPTASVASLTAVSTPAVTATVLPPIPAVAPTVQGPAPVPVLPKRRELSPVPVAVVEPPTVERWSEPPPSTATTTEASVTVEEPSVRADSSDAMHVVLPLTPRDAGGPVSPTAASTPAAVFTNSASVPLSVAVATHFDDDVSDDAYMERLFAPSPKAAPMTELPAWMRASSKKAGAPRPEWNARTVWAQRRPPHVSAALMRKWEHEERQLYAAPAATKKRVASALPVSRHAACPTLLFFSTCGCAGGATQELTKNACVW